MVRREGRRAGLVAGLVAERVGGRRNCSRYRCSADVRRAGRVAGWLGVWAGGAGPVAGLLLLHVLLSIFEAVRRVSSQAM